MYMCIYIITYCIDMCVCVCEGQMWKSQIYIYIYIFMLTKPNWKCSSHGNYCEDEIMQRILKWSIIYLDIYINEI